MIPMRMTGKDGVTGKREFDKAGAAERAPADPVVGGGACKVGLAVSEALCDCAAHAAALD